jgi:AcrR family transcriptional regulator
MRTLRSRRQQTADNREALLAAARSAFVRDGYHGTSVEAVAREAGLTIGAVYSQFGGKADLFLALLDRRVDERAAQVRGRSTRTDAVRAWTGILRTDLAWTLLVIEFRVHAARDPALAARFAELHERLIEAVRDHLGALFGAEHPRLDQAARVVLALGTGGALARAGEGERFPDGLIEEIQLAVVEHLLDAAATTTRELS